jgi:fatty-acyl-CoA synthase
MGMTMDGLSSWQIESEGIDLLDTTIGDLLDRRAAELPTQEAVVYSCYPEFGEAFALRWTYQEYRERANQVARGLMALGLNKGDHIAVWAVNLPEWLLLEMAAAKAGLVLVTVNPVLHVAEIEYILKQGDVRALFLMAKIRDHDCLATVRSLTTDALPGTGRRWQAGQRGGAQHAASLGPATGPRPDSIHLGHHRLSQRSDPAPSWHSQ